MSSFTSRRPRLNSTMLLPTERATSGRRLPKIKSATAPITAHSNGPGIHIANKTGFIAVIPTALTGWRSREGFNSYQVAPDTGATTGRPPDSVSFNYTAGQAVTSKHSVSGTSQPLSSIGRRPDAGQQTPLQQVFVRRGTMHRHNRHRNNGWSPYSGQGLSSAAERGRSFLRNITATQKYCGSESVTSKRQTNVLHDPTSAI